MKKDDYERLHLELRAEVTRISSAWSTTDIHMGILLAAILKTKVQLAMAVLWTVVSTQSRRAMILNAARLAFRSRRPFKRTEAMMRRVANAASRRNQFVHATLGVHASHPTRLLVISMSADSDPGQVHYELYNLNQIQEFVRQIERLNCDLLALALSLKKERRSPLHGTRL
jgi:hypothetical protein